MRPATRSTLTLLAFLLLSFASTLAARASEGTEVGATKNENASPNILWLTVEDIGPQLACYGDTTAATPNLDEFAKRSMVYDLAWSNYPVCAPARTTIISGMYAAAAGAGNMRSLARLPAGEKMFPQYLRDSGYYCTNHTKEDYNLKKPTQVWNQSDKEATWKNRGQNADGSRQPFFAVFNQTGTHESKIRKRPHEAIVDPASVTLLPYWPDVPEFRQDFAQYYDNLQTMDVWFGKKMKELEKSGEADNTIVIFYGDHGSGMPRHKRFAGDSGMKVPFIVHVPEKLREKFAPSEYKTGGRSSRPVGFIDLAPTVLSIAGIEAPAHMQGSAFMGLHEKEAPKYLYGFRDRMDERPDFSRSIRDQRFIYVRNFFPHVPAGQFIDYQQQTPCTAKWYAMHKAGELNEIQAHFWNPHPAEELYDLEMDPHETVNLASNPEHKKTLERFQNELRRNTMRVGDLGFVHEGRLQEITAAGKHTRRELADDKLACPLTRIFETALPNKKANELADILANEKNPTVRYWATLGLMNSGKEGFEQQRSLVLELLEDPAPEVSLTASEIILRHDSDADALEIARKLVAKFSDLSKGNQFYAVTALNIAERNREAMGGSMQAVLKVPVKDPDVNRGGKYVAQMVETISNGKD